MKKCLLLSIAIVLLTIPCQAQEHFQPKAKEAATVVQGNARFTVLTPQLIRMEWAADGKFEDNATLGIVNRELPVPEFKVRRSSKSISISTSALTLSYKGSGKFDAGNLQVSFKMAGPADKKGRPTSIKKTWKPGDDASGNLLSTCRTLDTYDGINARGPHGGFTKDPFDPGVISRDGWALIDESSRHLLVPVDSDWKYWVEERPEGDRIDWYIFAYGHEYTRALGDFVKVAGRIPLPPKYALGYWWCRYWLYSDAELVDLAEHFEAYSIPADVFIIDMDWHDTWAEKKEIARKAGVKKWKRDEAGEFLGWTGYTWKPELFPNPENLLDELHLHKLKTSLNLHPASGLQVYEEPYERFKADYLSRTDDYDGPKNYLKPDGSPSYVPFRMDQQEWADAYFNSVLHPIEEQGVDFWWLDWQQFRESKYVKGLSNTFWLNYTFWNDMARRSASMGKDAPRPMIYHRWGGIGSHRYQVGFSGDTYATWKVLGYLPEFTAQASNIGYAWWGHDIGGHMQPKGVNETDPELYTRWLQEGVFTPIFKTHSTKNFSMEKRFWVFPEHFDAMREAIRLRYDLSSYIYTAARQSYDTGIGLCRPLYYAWPEDERAYQWKEEFMFGDDILATVVCQPADPVTKLASRKMWFPEGSDWFDLSTGKMYAGGSEAELSYTIAENPWFVRAGAIIPLAGKSISNLQDASNELRLLVVPGAPADGKPGPSYKLYEDDGESQAYSSDFATTEFRQAVSADGILVSINPRKGSYKGMDSKRKISVILPGVTAPTEVLVNGKSVAYDRLAGKRPVQEAVWGYDGESLSLTVYLPETGADEALSISCKCEFKFIDGQKGVMKRLRILMPEVKAEFAAHVNGDAQLTPELLKLLGTPSFINEDPANAAKYLQEIDVEEIGKHLESLTKLPEDIKTRIMKQIVIK